MNLKKTGKIKRFVLNNRFLVACIAFILFFVVIILLIASIIFILPYFEDQYSHFLKIRDKQKSELSKVEINSQSIAIIEKDIKKFQQKLISKTPIASYFVVNTSANHFYLYKNRKLIREGLCSTGSYILLQGMNEQKWIFKTPRGEFRIRGKTTSPVWIKPDWAFIEEGLPVPSANDDSRYEYGVLGDYALSLGFGYMIHGTLYKRFLGMPVTHGCIRLGDDDLKAVYSNLDIGSKVFIF
jgi:hypothetical protein